MSPVESAVGNRKSAVVLFYLFFTVRNSIVFDRLSISGQRSSPLVELIDFAFHEREGILNPRCGKISTFSFSQRAFARSVRGRGRTNISVRTWLIRHQAHIYFHHYSFTTVVRLAHTAHTKSSSDPLVRESSHPRGPIQYIHTSFSLCALARRQACTCISPPRSTSSLPHAPQRARTARVPPHGRHCKCPSNPTWPTFLSSSHVVTEIPVRWD